MTLAIRQSTTVDEHHRVFAQVDELEPGQTVEIIVLADSAIPEPSAQSFWSAVRAIRVDDLPEDYSTTFAENLYNPQSPE
jgi:hypothetical protein